MGRRPLRLALIHQGIPLVYSPLSALMLRYSPWLQWIHASQALFLADYLIFYGQIQFGTRPHSF